ncbi:MAG TPA: hypothetical protein DDW52_19800, partial [Planctomycetaceae bacterium]|nr:hypothetical protein [Planctomycetaceae bacterium]
MGALYAADPQATSLCDPPRVSFCHVIASSHGGKTKRFANSLDNATYHQQPENPSRDWRYVGASHTAWSTPEVSRIWLPESRSRIGKSLSPHRVIVLQSTYALLIRRNVQLAAEDAGSV